MRFYGELSLIQAEPESLDHLAWTQDTSPMTVDVGRFYAGGMTKQAEYPGEHLSCLSAVSGGCQAENRGTSLLRNLPFTRTTTGP